MCAVVLCAACSEPPRKEIDRAQQAIEDARRAGAEQYAPETFAAATAALQQSHEAVDQRDYRLALSRAGVDCLELATDGKLVDAIMRFADLRKRRSQLAAGGGIPQHMGAA